MLNFKNKKKSQLKNKILLNYSIKFKCNFPNSKIVYLFDCKLFDMTWSVVHDVMMSPGVRGGEWCILGSYCHIVIH